MEEKLKKYISIGNYYVSKKFILFVLAILAALPPVVIQAVIPAWKHYTGIERLYMNSDEFLNHAGVAEVYNLKDRRIYKGGLNLGQFEGRGILYGVNGNVLYEGEFLESTFHGQGTLYSADGEIKYQGEFVQNSYEGNGQLYDSGLVLYDGEFKQGFYNGEGILYLNQSLKYNGTFKNGQRHGFGTVYQSDNIVYSGFFEDDMFEGQGKLYNENTILIYEGLFHRNQYSGEGRQYTDNGRLKYSGAHTFGKKNGFGDYYGQTGSLMYSGLFVYDEIDYISWLGASYDKIMNGFAGRYSLADNAADVDFFYSVNNGIIFDGLSKKRYIAIAYERMKNVFVFEADKDGNATYADAICLFGEQKTLGISNGKMPPIGEGIIYENYCKLPEYFRAIVKLDYFSNAFFEISADSSLYRRIYRISDDTQISCWSLTPKTDILFYVIEYITYQGDDPEPTPEPEPIPTPNPGPVK